MKDESGWTKKGQGEVRDSGLYGLALSGTGVPTG
jgi:hypothetical protein